MSRAFLALALPEKVRNRLAEEADRLRLAGAAVSWSRPEDYHITLRFLGDLADEDLLELDPRLRAAAEGFGGLALVAQGLSLAPDPQEPRVVRCGIVPEGEDEELDLLRDLRQSVDGALSACGWRREKTRFHPHVTLGRIRGPENLEGLRERIGPAARREFGHFRATDLVLYESVRERGRGNAYEPLQVFSLL